VRNSQNAAWALTARGYFYVMQGELEAAARDFDRAVERDAYHAPALYGRGAVAVRQGRQAEGEADMARALDMNRWQVEYYANAGLRP
jgi:tetratricopeptide (TPR) repeat protein